MRLMLFGALVPAILIVAAPADARSSRINIPVQIDPNSSVHVLWVKVQAGEGRTIVSGYIRRKQWFARTTGNLHIALLKNWQQVACRESTWRKYRFHSRGQWRFTSTLDVDASNIDAVRISYVAHDRETGRSPDILNACTGSASSTEPHSDGA